MKTADIKDFATVNGDTAFFAAAIHYVRQDDRQPGRNQLTKVRFLQSLGSGEVQVEVMEGHAEGKVKRIRVQDVICTWDDHEVARKEREEREERARNQRNARRDLAEQALTDAGFSAENSDVQRSLEALGKMLEEDAIVRTIQPHVYEVEAGYFKRKVLHLLDDKKFVIIGDRHWNEAQRDRAALLLVKMHLRSHDTVVR